MKETAEPPSPLPKYISDYAFETGFKVYTYISVEYTCTGPCGVTASSSVELLMLLAFGGQMRA